MHKNKSLAERIETLTTGPFPDYPCISAVPQGKTLVERTSTSPHATVDSKTTEVSKATVASNPTVVSNAHAEPGSQQTESESFVYFPYDVKNTFPASRTNQFINIVYFGTCAALFQWLSKANPGLISPTFTFSFLALTAISSLFFVKYRTFVSTNDELPRWAQKILRGFAFLIPALMFCGVVLMTPATVTSDYTDLYHGDRPRRVELIEPTVTPGTIDQKAFDREMKIGEKLLAKQKYADAAIHFERAKTINPRSEYALIRLAECWYDVWPHHRDRAIEYANQVIAINPKSFDAHFYLADSYNDFKQFDWALPHAQFLTSDSPSFGRGWSILYKSEFGAKHFDAALKAAEAHIRLHPKEMGARRDRMNAFTALGRKQEAEADRAILKAL